MEKDTQTQTVGGCLLLFCIKIDTKFGSQNRKRIKEKKPSKIIDT